MILFSFLFLFFHTFLISTECKKSFVSRYKDEAVGAQVPRKSLSNQSESHGPSAADLALISSLKTGNLKLANDLYDIVRKEPGNIIFSPLSLELALILVYNGASGNTSSEIKRALRLPNSKEDSLKAAQAIMELSNKFNDNSLKIANGIFLDHVFSIKPEYIDTSKDYLSAEVKKVNFGRSSEAAKTINKFIDERTNHTIANLFSPDSFDARTKVVLVNTVYFMGHWAKQFYDFNTYEGDFNLNERENKKIQFMTRKIEDLEISDDKYLDATVVKLKYHSRFNRYKSSMVVLIPKQINGLTKLEKAIKSVDLVQLAKDNLRCRKIEFHLPKFKIDKTLNLESILPALGMGEMLSQEKANFRGLSYDGNVYLQKIFQKAYIEVHEKGTVAAAATIGEFGPTSIDTETYTKVSADRPFIFYILDEEIGLPIFMGRVVNP